MKNKDIYLLITGGVTLACLEILWNLPLGRFPIYWLPVYQPLVALVLNFLIQIILSVIPLTILGWIVSLLFRRRFRVRWFLLVYAAGYLFYMGATVWWRLFGLVEFMTTPFGDEVEPGWWLTLGWGGVVIVLLILWIRLDRYIKKHGFSRCWTALLLMSAIIGSITVCLHRPLTPFPLLLLGTGVIFLFHAAAWFFIRRRRVVSSILASWLLGITVLVLVVRSLWAMTGGETSRPNIMLLVWDTVRADRMSAYGYPGAATENVEELAGHGVRFQMAHATANFTFASHVGMFTGKYNREHGLGYGRVDDLKEYNQLDTLADYLRRSGYRTLLATENIWVAPLHKGFEWYHWLDTRCVKCLSQHAPAEHHRAIVPYLVPFFRNCPSPFFTRQLLDHLRYEMEGYYKYMYDRYQLRLVQEQLLLRRSCQPVFICLNWMNVHNLYHPYSSYRGGEEVMPFDWPKEYDLAMEYTDKRLGELLGIFRRSGTYGSTVFILTSDHGELLGEYDIYGHKRTLFQPVLHVPLVVACSSWPGGSVVEPPVTLASLKGAVELLATPEICSPGGLERLVSFFLDHRGVVAEHKADGLEEGFKSFTFISKDGNKLIYDEQNPVFRTTWGDTIYFSFSLSDDPEEKNNVFESKAELRCRLLDEYKEWQKNTPAATFSGGKGEYPAGLKSRLKAMGYI